MIDKLCFIYRQKGKQPEKGVLSATATYGLKKTVLLIDSFTLTGDPRRNSFVRKLYDTKAITRKDFPAEFLTQVLLEMAGDALMWNEPPVEKVKPLPDKPLKGLAFEMMLANLKSPPPCCLERTVYPQKERGA